MNNVVLITGIVSLIISVIILLYVLELERENCDCSQHWMRDMIKYWTGVVIVVGVLNLVAPQVLKACSANPICSVLHALYGLVGLVYIIILIVYYVHLERQTDCPCASDWKKHALIVPIVVFAIVFILAFVKGFTNASALKRLSGRKLSNGPKKSNKK
jgi:hypothetical protein